MKQLRRFSQSAFNLLRQAIQTTHGRMVLGGLVVGLCYFPVWLTDLVMRSHQGSTGLVLVAGVLYLGFQDLWKQRQRLAKLQASEEDQLIGHLLIGAAIVLFPFCRFALWSQAAVWLIVLAGIACSTWGAGFFLKYPLPTLLIPLSIYPRPGEAIKMVWLAVTPSNQLLERLMAWAGSLALRAIGQPVQVSGTILSLHESATRVDWGCSGFNMAVAMGVTGLLVGLFFEQSRLRTISLILIGIIVALLFNVVRVALVTLALAYWGDYWFDFWHGSWGAQIFVGILFTLYYYTVIPILKKQKQKRKLQQD